MSQVGRRARRWAAVGAVLLVVALMQQVVSERDAAEAAATLPAGFTDTVAMSGFNNPAAVAFAPDGKVFVAERTGKVKVLDSVSDPTPALFADLSLQVYNEYDRGMLGITVDPQWPTRPYVYVMYAYDGDPGGPFPKWGSTANLWDPCPDTTNGCVISNRLSRLTANAAGTAMTAEKVLVAGWCQQFSSHSAGQVRFGADGALYASAGEGASYKYSDYGQTNNACGDPPSPAGTDLTPPTAQGGSLRAQSIRRPASQPGVLNGTLIRVDPDTGDARPDNPLASSADVNRRRVVAYGMRNPFRFAFRPGTSEAWIGDVGSGAFEEIDRLPSRVGTTSASNFGWPCYEGTPRRAAFDSLDLDSCETLYAAGTAAVAAPHFAYDHAKEVVAGDGCPTANGSSITGVAFSTSTTYPAAYRGGLFFTDYARQCIWYLPKGADGLPDASAPQVFATGIPGAVDLQTGPDGDLYYVDLLGDAIHRIRYTAGNQAPVAVATATPSSGAAPLTVQFNSSASSDADGDAITRSWDLDGNGTYGDSTAVAPSRTYSTVGTVTVGLRVTDAKGAVGSTTVTVSVGNAPPVPEILTPSSTLAWKVGDAISFSGRATDVQDGTLAGAKLSWKVLLHHCVDACHTHQAAEYAGVASGSFLAPDHEYPSYLELVLTATDAGGLSASTSIELRPATATLDLRTEPPGLAIVVDEVARTAPTTATVLASSTTGLAVPTTQTLGGVTYAFSSWSDGGAAAHDITAPASGTATYTARFTATTAQTAAPGPVDGFSAAPLSSTAWATTLRGSTVGVANGRLEIVHPAGAWTSGTVDSRVAHDQRGKAVQAQLVRAPSLGKGNVTATMALRLDATRTVSLLVAGSSVLARVNTGAGDVVLASVAYDPVAMRWLRFREVGGTLFWEYAASASGPWKVLASRADPFAMGAVTLRLSAGSAATVSDLAAWDDVATFWAGGAAPGPVDGFSAAPLSSTAWATTLRGSTVGVANGRLEIVHPAGAWTSGTVDSRVAHDQRGKAVQAQLVRAPSLGKGNVTATMALRLDATRTVSLLVGGSSVSARVNTGAGDVVLASVAYDPVAMRWLRFREVGGTLFWEYAASASGPWKVLASRADPFAMGAVTLRLSAGSAATVSDLAAWDDVATVWAG